MRIKWYYFEKVKVPQEFLKYLCEYKDEAPLEVLILRVLKYGKFEETEKIAFKYPEIRRSVKFWIKRWISPKF